MTTRLRSSFTLFDAMALTAATALAFWLARQTAAVRGADLWNYPGSGIALSIRQCRSYADWIAPVLSVYALTSILLRMRQPRPRLASMFRQPGVAACLPVMAVVGIEIVSLATSVGLSRAGLDVNAGAGPFMLPRFSEQVSIAWLLSAINKNSPSAIAGVWLMLACSGRWRPVAGWGDHFGRVYRLIILCLGFLGGILTHLGC